MLRTVILLALGGLVHALRAQTPTIVGYEYWFDQDPVPVSVDVVPGTTVNLNNVDLNTSNLAVGPHTAHLRLKGNDGTGAIQWSSVVTRSLDKYHGGPWQIVAVRYWWSNLANPPAGSDLRYKYFDNPQTAVNYSGWLDLCGYPENSDAQLKLQLLDSHGQWSSVVVRNVSIVAANNMAINSIDADPISYCTGQQVTFTATASTAPNFAMPTSYDWNFPGDWTIVLADGDSAVVVIGTMPASVSVTGSNYCQQTASLTIDVDCPPDVDCEGVVGGTALPGTPCDDGIAGTNNDTYAANCECLGEDCLGVMGGPAVPGTPCDDGIAGTDNDTYAANCECLGEDCLGVMGGPALPGTPCDDGNPNTTNETWSANCECTVLPVVDCEGTVGGTALPGTPCDDGIPGTTTYWNFDCQCGAGGEYYMGNPFINTCQGALLDSQGNGGPYNNNENFTTTICPDGPGVAISLQWIIFNLSTAGAVPLDQLSIFDGTSISDPLIGTWQGNDNPGIISASFANITGCLTVVFTSNEAGTGEFAAAIACFQPCEPPTAVATTNPSGPVLVCNGGAVDFDGTGSFASPGNTLQQWVWDFGDGVIDSIGGATVSHLFTEPGEYLVQLTIVDDLGCSSTNSVDLQVFVSASPSFFGTTTSQTICFGDSLVLEGVATPFGSGNTPPFQGPIPLPDLQGVPYTAPVELTGFDLGEVLVSESQLSSVCVNMEHSYMGDLVIELACPNGQSVVLHQQGGGGTYLGIPVDDESDVMGTCWEYCWSAAATNGTWVDNTGGTLPSDTYESLEPFSDLVGCPLNGTWTLTITDLFAIDNGFLCSWDMEVAGDGWPSIISGVWSGDLFIPDPNQIYSGWAVPAQPGNSSYTFTVEDELGCEYDTTVVFFVPDLQIDTINGPWDPAAGSVVTYTIEPELSDADSILWGPLPIGWSWLDPDSTNGEAILNVPGQTGSFTLCAQATADGCVGNLECIGVVVVGINDAWMTTEDVLHLAPNPSDGHLQLTRERASSTLTIEVLDPMGRIMLATSMVGTMMPLDLSDLSSGAYQLRWKSGDRVRQLSFVIAQ